MELDSLSIAQTLSFVQVSSAIAVALFVAVTLTVDSEAVLAMRCVWKHWMQMIVLRQDQKALRVRAQRAC